MAGELTRKRTPEERELEKKQKALADLEAELLKRELELSTLQAELQAFEARYLKAVGTRYAELDQIEARIAEAEARNRPDDPGAQDKATEARERSKESSGATGDLPPEPKKSFVPSDRLKALFREVVKRLHPDLTTDETERERRHVLMAEANWAYAEDDEEKLRALLNDAEANPDAVVGDGVGAELIRIIRKIAQVEERLEHISAEIENLQKSDLWKLAEKTELAEENGIDLLSEMTERVDTRISAARERLARVSWMENHER